VVPRARLWAGGRHTSGFGLPTDTSLNFKNDYRTSRRRALGKPRVGLDNACEISCELSLSHLNRWTVLGHCSLRGRKGLMRIA
jgi:hypothetical protein